MRAFMKLFDIAERRSTVRRTVRAIAAALSAILFLAVPSAAYSPLPPSDTIAAMPKYDGREYGIVTPVRDQGSTNLCWAYSSIAAAETSILRSGIAETTPTLNPLAAAYRTVRRGEDPLGNTSGDWQSVDFTAQTGSALKIAKIFSMWWGPTTDTRADADPFADPAYRFENAFYIPENKDDPDAGIAAIKSAIAEYGAVTFQYNNLRETQYYNPKNERGASSSPHACTLIGWDDTIPAEKFVPDGASRDGGWLVKNSYSSCEYFWLSYDNTSTNTYAFTFAPADKYDFNYYYDGNMDDFALRSDKVCANVYEAAGATAGKFEYLRAVNVAVSGENVRVEAEIYKNLDYPFGGQSDVPVSGGVSAAKIVKEFDHGGYVTLETEEPVRLDPGEWFSVIVRVSNPTGDARIVTAYKDTKNLSYVSSGDNWNKLGNFVARIKAYTTLEEETKIVGDANGDGIVDSRDAAQIYRRLAGWDVSIDSDSADVNGDGEVNSKDAAMISRKVAGWSENFG